MPSVTDWIMAASALAGTVFAGALFGVARRQTRMAERQTEISEKQAAIQQAQHDLQVHQDAARKPVLEILNVTVVRWEADGLWFNAEIANAGGSQVTPNTVLLRWKTREGRQDGKFGRVLHRIPREAGNLLQPGDVATFSCQIKLQSKPDTSEETMSLKVLAVDGTQSMEIPFRAP